MGSDSFHLPRLLQALSDLAQILKSSLRKPLAVIQISLLHTSERDEGQTQDCISLAKSKHQVSTWELIYLAEELK